MKEGYVVENAISNTNIEDELKLINQYTRRNLKSDEVYIFSVVLCDNDIDRDFDRFSNDSLFKLAELFVGKTGIIDHENKSKNQTARIFSCNVEQVKDKKNKLGEPYYRLMARAYMPRCEKNNDFILQIDSGIIKEVSVGCSVEKSICSICGKNLKIESCNHQKGRKYKGSVCHTILEDPVDAYEWSFVAVPAQKKAGVVKVFDSKRKGGVNCFMDVIEKIKNKEEVSITKSQSEELYSYINKLELLAREGETYRNDLKKEVLKLCFIAQPEINSKVMANVAEKMSLNELKEFKKAFSSRANDLMPPKPQLSPILKDKTIKDVSKSEFKIGK